MCVYVSACAYACACACACVQFIACVMFAVASHMFKTCLFFVNQLCALLWGTVAGRLPVNAIQFFYKIQVLSLTKCLLTKPFVRLSHCNQYLSDNAVVVVL